MRVIDAATERILREVSTRSCRHEGIPQLIYRRLMNINVAFDGYD